MIPVLAESNIPLLGVIGTMSAVVAAWAGVVTLQRARRKKILSYRVLESTKLFDFADVLGETVDVRVKGRPAPSIAVTFVEFVNRGTEVIDIADFVAGTKMAFSLPGCKEILHCAIDRSSPSVGSVAMHGEGERVEVDPVMMNRDTSLVLKIITLEEPDRVEKAVAQIRGLTSEFCEYDPESEYKFRAWMYLSRKCREGFEWLMVMIMFAVLIGIGYGIAKHQDKDASLEQDSDIYPVGIRAIDTDE